MAPKMGPIFDEFLAEHPKYATGRRAYWMLDSAGDVCISVDAFGAFLHWCVLRGYAGPHDMTAFLTDVAPHMRTLAGDDAAE